MAFVKQKKQLNIKNKQRWTTLLIGMVALMVLLSIVKPIMTKVKKASAQTPTVSTSPYICQVSFSVPTPTSSVTPTKTLTPTSTPTVTPTVTATPTPNINCIEKVAIVDGRVVSPPAQLIPGQTYRYGISYQNSGTVPVSGAYILDRLPQEVLYQNNASGAVCTQQVGNSIRCDIPGVIPPQQFGTVQFDVQVNPLITINPTVNPTGFPIRNDASVYPPGGMNPSCIHYGIIRIPTTTPTITVTATPSVTSTPTVTATPSVTATPTKPTSTPSVTATPTKLTSTPSVTATPTKPTSTPSVTTTPTKLTSTPSVTATPTKPTSTPSVTAIPTRPTSTPSVTATPTRPTSTPSVTVTPSAPPCENCNYQIDLFYGPLIESFAPLPNGTQVRYGARIINVANDRHASGPPDYPVCDLISVTPSPVVVPTLPAGCENPTTADAQGRKKLTGTVDASHVAFPNGYALAYVDNNTGSAAFPTRCTYDIGLAAYKAAWTTSGATPDPSEIDNQNLAYSSLGTVGPGERAWLLVFVGMNNDNEVLCHTTVPTPTVVTVTPTRIQTPTKTLTPTKTPTKTPTPPPTECLLEITKSVYNETKGISGTTASPGDVLRYTINFRNAGTRKCTGGGSRVKDIMNNKLTYLSQTSGGTDIDAGYSGYPVYESSTRTLRWDTNILAAGESGWIRWRAKVKRPAACGNFTITNQAKMNSLEYYSRANGGSEDGYYPDPSKGWVSSNVVTTNVSYPCGAAAQGTNEVLMLSQEEVRANITCDMRFDTPVQNICKKDRGAYPIVGTIVSAPIGSTLNTYWKESEPNNIKSSVKTYKITVLPFTFTIDAEWPGINAGDKSVKIRAFADIFDAQGNQLPSCSIATDIHWYPYYQCFSVVPTGAPEVPTIAPTVVAPTVSVPRAIPTPRSSFWYRFFRGIGIGR